MEKNGTRRLALAVVRRSAAAAIFATIVVTPALARAADFKIVSNPAVAEARLTAMDCSRLLLKKQQHWADGSAVVPVDLPSASAVRKRLSEVVHRRPTVAIDAYWQKMLFTGQGVPPIVLGTDAEVVGYVRTHAGAIGYVSADAAVAGVKVIELE